MGNRGPPPRGKAGGPRRDPPLPHPPYRPASRGGAGPHPPEAERMVPPPPGGTAAPERGARARPAAPPQPPAHTGAAENKRTRANVPGRHTHRAQRRRAGRNRSSMGATPLMTRRKPETPALLPAQGRQTDGARQSDPPPHGGRGAQAAPPPPTPPPGRADPPHGGRTIASQVGGKRDRAAPLQARQTEQGTGAGHAEGHGPRGTALPAPSAGTARGARATPARGAWGGSGRRGSASAHTHKGHAGNTRRAIRPSSLNAQTAWNAVPASEGKGHPDGTARHTQRGTRGAGRRKGGGHDTRYRPEPPEPAASAAHTGTGHCTRQGSSGALRQAPTPRLGSHRASPRGSHWRQASSTDPAAPAPRATTH